MIVQSANCIVGTSCFLLSSIQNGGNYVLLTYFNLLIEIRSQYVFAAILQRFHLQIKLKHRSTQVRIVIDHC